MYQNEILDPVIYHKIYHRVISNITTVGKMLSYYDSTSGGLISPVKLFSYVHIKIHSTDCTLRLLFLWSVSCFVRTVVCSAGNSCEGKIEAETKHTPPVPKSHP